VCSAARRDDIYGAVYNNEYSIKAVGGGGRSGEGGRVRNRDEEGEVVADEEEM